MKLLHTIAETRAACKALRSSPATLLGLVPTMGALHAGHLSLVRAAKQQCDHVAVSIFVNPTQFGPLEDLDRYPRTLDADCALLRAEGVDLVFAPGPEEMYPTGVLRTFVDPGDLGNRLDGRTRPGHFRGVATVVTKLFNIVQPDRAFFGQKDAAQVSVLRAMVRDLDIPVELVVCPTVRDPDGLALSSRNRYLTREDREHALVLSRALAGAQRLIEHGERRVEPLFSALHQCLSASPVHLDYVEIVDADTLLPAQAVEKRTLIALAAKVGDTRLIDNLPVAEILPEIAS